MSNPTTPFSWQMPTATDLVTDLPADFEVFGQAVATSMADLLGGPSGYILSKASATDMDFTWIANDQGDITGITAGNGITVTSPTGPVPTVAIDTSITVDKTTAQTLTNKTLTSPALTTPTISTATTNGDLLYGTGSGALQRLGIGSTAQVLTVASGVPSWATPAGGGKLLQVVTGTTATQVLNSTATFADTGLTATITPSAASSRILVFVNHTNSYKSASNANNGLHMKLFRGATELVYTPSDSGYNGQAQESYFSVSLSYDDSPSSTSALTYKTQFANSGAYANVGVQRDNRASSIVLMEIGA